MVLVVFFCCFFWQLCWIRGLCFSFISCLFQVWRGTKKFEDWGEFKSLRSGGLPFSCERGGKGINLNNHLPLQLRCVLLILTMIWFHDFTCSPKSTKKFLNLTICRKLYTENMTSFKSNLHSVKEAWHNNCATEWRKSVQIQYNSVPRVKLWNIKHQSRLKVLHKFYYLKRDILVILVEAVFKLIKVQHITITQYKMTSNFNVVFSFFWTEVSTHLS